MMIKTFDNIFIRSHEAAHAKADLWFIHGFGDSGLSYREAFSSRLIDHFNLFVPDCPGFGASPLSSKALTIEETTDSLQNLIQKISQSNPIGIIAHSLGGLIGTRLCQKLTNPLKGFINIEGNFTEADCFFSGKTANFDSAKPFYKFFTDEIVKLISKNPNDDILKRYYASLRFADPEALFTWGRSAVKATGKTKGGEDFLSLSCNKIYFWGSQSLPKTTSDFIQHQKIPNKCFQGSGHWPMIDASKKCYEEILEFFSP